jgi:hypothetical protein
MANLKITDLTLATTPLAGTELLEIVQASNSRKVAASDIAASATNVRTVATGGTGAATLTGYVKGNGTSAMTAAATVPYADLAGRAFAQPSSNVDQTGNVAAATAVTFDTGLTGTGINVVSSTQVTLTAAGTYMFAPSIQLSNSDASDRDATIWFRKNGTNIASSATILTVPKLADGGTAVFSLSFIDTVTAGQYIEIMWLPESVTVTIEAIAIGAIAPAIPSVILPVTRIA